MSSHFTEEEQRLLSKYVSDPTGPVYVVYPAAMPGMIGAAYARYSRAKGGFRETLLKEFIEDGHLDAEHADKLITRVLIAFGDDSVQEMESAWVSIEEVSNVLTKIIEDLRLTAAIEQSTRYVFYDQVDEAGRFRYYREPTIMASRHAKRFEETMDFVFGTYVRLIEPMQEYFRGRKPLAQAQYEIRQGQGKTTYAQCQDDEARKDFERTYKMDIRTKACDTLRILLPACTRTNVGLHTNGRSFEHLLRRLYSSDLPEAQTLATQIHAQLNTVIPRYVQRAARSEYLVETRHAMQTLADELLGGIEPAPSRRGITLLPRDLGPDGQLAAMLFPFCRHSMEQLVALIKQWGDETRQRIRRTYIGQRRTRRDRPGRALEFGYPWEIEMVLDLGIYRDLHRHRMLTQERQRYTVELGFTTLLDDIREAGFLDDVMACVERVDALYYELTRDLGPDIAQYVVLLGHNIRCRFGFNDRAIQHLLELRTGPQGHRNYRLVGQELYRLMIARDGDRIRDMLGFVDLNDYDWPRGDSEAGQRAKEAKLTT
ncbi:MAG: FAD-dependent thymidylate synthase [Candidatus Kerfeldbacteria bacterium]|nr:FAD-dependent thymidylate synthase [Candidatus Kerfeldbacteria bacterium]